MIEFSCPKCDSELEATNEDAGKKVTCPDCGNKFSIPAAKGGKKESPLTARKPAPKAPPKKTAPAGPRRRRDEDEDDEDDLPRGKKKGGSKAPLIILLSVLGVLLLGGGVLAVVLMSGKKDEPVASPAPPPGPPPNMMGMRPGGPNMPGGPNAPGQQAAANNPPAGQGAVIDKPAEGGDKKEDTGLSGAASADGQKISQRLLKSTVLIINIFQLPDGKIGTGMGSGSLIDRENRLILTNYHVVGPSAEVAVFFPIYKDGRMITEQQYFFDAARSNSKAGYRGKVLKKEMAVDLAIVQLDKLPDEALALPFSPAGAAQAQSVFSMGHPGRSGGLWVYTRGEVRQLMHKEWVVLAPPPMGKMECKAEVVLTNSATNPGDSGGPIVNGRAELVAVVHGGDPGSQLMSFNIDVKEVRKFLERHAAESGMKVQIRTGSDLVDTNPGDLAGLIRGLDHKDPKVRSSAAESLGAMGANAKMAVPKLLKAVKDSDDLVRRFALRSLSQIGPPDKGDWAELQAVLKDSNPDVRLYAVESLGKLGPDAVRAVPALLETLKDSDPAVKQGAARALAKVGGGAKDKVFPALCAAVKDSDRELREAAGEALAGLKPLTAADVPPLLELLKEKESEARVAAARTLKAMGPEAKSAIKPLTAHFQDPDVQVRRAAVEAVAAFGADTREVMPDLIKALRDGDTQVKGFAIVALGKIGPDAKEASAAISDALKDLALRKQALVALEHIGPAAFVPAAPNVVDILLKDTEKENRIQALVTLAALKPSGGDASKVVPAVVQLLDDSESDVREKTAEALAKFGKVAVPHLIQVLRHPKPVVRLGAVNALGRIGPDAKMAVQPLQLLAQGDLEKTVRDAAIKALGSIQSGLK